MNYCGKPVERYVPKGYDYKLVTYKCGNTGIDGYPVLCSECSEDFDSTEYREDVEANGERIEEDY